MSLRFYAAGFPLSPWESSLIGDDRYAGEQHAAQIPSYTLRGNDETGVTVQLNGIVK